MKEKPIFQLIAKDFNKDREGSWAWLAVIHFTGEPAMEPEGGDTVSEDQIREVFRFLESYDIYVRSAGNGGAGQPFAAEPFIQWFPNHIVITQSGGLDV